jgi:hypothetical protein
MKMLILSSLFFMTGDMQDRKRSQLLGIIVLGIMLLLIACLRYYFRLG